MGQQQRYGRCVQPWAGDWGSCVHIRLRASALGWTWDSDKRGLSGCREQLAGSSLDPSGHVHTQKEMCKYIRFHLMYCAVEVGNVFRNKFRKMFAQ